MCIICEYYGLKGPDILSDQFLHEDNVESAPKDSINETKYIGLFSDYTFHQVKNNRYKIKTPHGFDEITGISKLVFTDKTISTTIDIKGTFDQITGLNTNDAKIFRLYNAATKGLPNPLGLRYWINQRNQAAIDERSIVKELMLTNEFANIYGNNTSHRQYVNNLYENILYRNPDIHGFSYWLGQLNSEDETREEVFLGFTESTENKTLFTKVTGFE
tara:strand:- start:95 stop:745 length:651 start_codon:yes stop_codon:yes gene_type:complete